MHIDKSILNRLEELLEKSDHRVPHAAIIVRDHEIVSEGFARQLSNKHADAEEFFTHAEESAIINALNNQKDLSGSDIYVLGMRPDSSIRLTDGSYCCINCSKLIKQTEIINVFYPVEDGWKKVTKDEMFEQAENRIQT